MAFGFKNKLESVLGLDKPEAGIEETDDEFKNETGIIDIQEEVEVPKQNKKFVKEEAKEEELPINSDMYQMILSEPEDYSEPEVRNIAKEISSGKMLTLNLEKLDEKSAIRLMNFLSGAMLVIGSTFVKVSNKVFTIVPKNMKVLFAKGKTNKIIPPQIFENLDKVGNE